MCKTPVCQQITGGIFPKGCNKINIGDALRKGTKEHGPLAQSFTGNGLANTGAQYYVSK